jgi:hypothetical protein
MDPSRVQPPFHNIAAACAGAAAAATANVASRTRGSETNTLYGGNIAAACEAANLEAAKKQGESSQAKDDENAQRRRAASRITAWQSRERKRIEMEVLQERKAELTCRNSDIRSENEQLRLLIEKFRTITANPYFQGPSQHQTQTLTQSTLHQRASNPLSTGVPTRPTLLRLDGRAGNHALPSSSFNATSTHILTESAILAAALGLQHDLGSLIPSSNPLSFGMSQNNMINQNQQIQQKQDPQGSNLPSNIFSTQFSLPHTFIGLQDMISPLTRQQTSFPGNTFAGMNPLGQFIVPLQRQESVGGVPLLNLSAIASPARAETKCGEPEDSKKETDTEGTKGSVE